MMKRNRFTWAYYDYGLGLVALAGLDNDKINFKKKIDEVGLSDKSIFEIFVQNIEHLYTAQKNYKSEEDVKSKQLLKKIIDEKVKQIKLDIKELEIELFKQ